MESEEGMRRREKRGEKKKEGFISNTTAEFRVLEEIKSVKRVWSLGVVFELRI